MKRFKAGYQDITSQTPFYRNCMIQNSGRCVNTSNYNTYKCNIDDFQPNYFRCRTRNTALRNVAFYNSADTFDETTFISGLSGNSIDNPTEITFDTIPEGTVTILFSNYNPYTDYSIRILEEHIKNLPDIYAKSHHSNNYKILDIERKTCNTLREDLYNINNILDINNANGKTLDLYGERVGQTRGVLSDADYLIKIKSKMARNRSNGSYMSVFNGLLDAFSCQQSEISVIEGNKSGSIQQIIIPMRFVESSQYRIYEALNVIKSLIPIGVKVDECVISGTFEFSAGYQELKSQIPLYRNCYIRPDGILATNQNYSTYKCNIDDFQPNYFRCRTRNTALRNVAFYNSADTFNHTTFISGLSGNSIDNPTEITFNSIPEGTVTILFSNYNPYTDYSIRIMGSDYDENAGFANADGTIGGTLGYTTSDHQ